MPTGSGLDAQFMFAPEATWGTAVTPTRALEFNSEEVQLEPEWIEGAGLRPGVKYKRTNRVRQSRRSVTGELEMEVVNRGMGVLWKHLLGSALTAPTQVAATTAYSANFVPGDFLGLGLTVQLGRPEAATGTVRPHTFAGVKIPEWEFALTDEDIPMLTLTLDGREESTATALATPTYPTNMAIFGFDQATLLLGGTPTTTAGRTTVAGGTAAATIVREFTLTGETPMHNERFGIGNAGLKAQQLENDIPTITGELVAEFNRAELYDRFANNTPFAMVLRLVGSAIGVSGEFFTLEFTLPSVRLKTAAPTVDGAEVVMMETEFECYADETNPVIQIRTISDETAF